MQGEGPRDKVELSTLQGLKSVAQGDENDKVGEEGGERMLLLKRNYSVSQPKEKSDALLRYVLGGASESFFTIDKEFNDPDTLCHDGVWVEFEARLQFELDLIEQQQQDGASDDTCSSFPGDVISRERGACEVRTGGDGCCTVLGLESFSSVSGIFPKTAGKYIYEAQLQTSGVMQLGWMTPSTIFTSEDGIGDSRDSFAFDGKRLRKWNVNSEHYGVRWAAGDIITCGIDLEQKKVEFWRNGASLGVAFASIPVGSNVEYRPGVSLSYGESVELNFGSRPLRYPVEGYSTLVDPPSKTKIDKCEYLVACLERLVLFQDGEDAKSPGAAAAKAATQATDMLFSLSTAENDDNPKKIEEHVEDGDRSEDEDDLFKEAASALGLHLEPLLESDYLIDLSVTRALNRMRDFSEHNIKILRRFIGRLLEHLDDQKCQRALHSICEYFGRSIKASQTIQDEVHNIPNINALFLWNQFLSIKRYKNLWLSSEHWKNDLENLLFTRLPTHKDLESLVPLTSGPEGEDVLKNLETDSMKNELKIDAVSDLIVYFSELENCQMDVLLHLFEEENTQCTGEGHSHNMEQNEEELRRCVESYLELHKNEQVTSAPSETWVSMVVNVLNSRTCGVPERLVDFFKHLCEKNGRSRRDVPPPNMSHKSVLASFLSFTLRGTRPFLMSHQVKGKNFNFPAQVFLQGIRSEISSSNDEDLQIDSRLGGNLSYLLKESLVELCRATPLTLEVPSLPSSLCKDDWHISKNERPEGMFLKGDPSWSWWFIVASFALYHFGAENLLKMNQRYLHTFEAALGSFRALGERLEAEEENSTTEFLKFSLRECKKTMLESLRQSIWYLTWLMPSWKQETLAATASVMSRILSSAVNDDSQLITFVPEFYIVAILDMIQNCRRADQRSWPDSGYIYTGYFSPVLDLCLKISMDVRVKSPEVQSSILHTLWAMLKEEDTCEFISKSDSAYRMLFPCLIEAFTSSQNWIHASNGFGLLVQSSGMSPRIASLVAREGNLLYESQFVIRGWLSEFLEKNQEMSCKLLDSLIERINWIATEIISLVEDLSKVLIENSIELDDVALLYRRTQAAFDLFYHLCRLLELCCDCSPKSILDSTASAELLCTRLAEFLAWGIKSFGENSHVSHEMDLIHENSSEKLGHYGRSIELATSIEILGPMLGVLSSLQRKSSEEEKMEQSINMSQDLAQPSKACNMSEQWHKMLHNLHDLGLTSVELRQALLSISDEDISALIKPSQQESDTIKTIVTAFECIETDKLKRAAIVQDLQPAPSIPDEFMDPILNILMTEPVILPDSKVTLDRKTIQRHLKNSQTDPFSRKELTEDELIPNEELKAKLMEWLANSQQRQQD